MRVLDRLKPERQTSALLFHDSRLASGRGGCYLTGMLFNWNRIRWAAVSLLCGAVLFAQIPAAGAASAPELKKGGERMQTAGTKSKRAAVKKKTPRKMTHKSSKGKKPPVKRPAHRKSVTH
jgi:hypothetical protein